MQTNNIIKKDISWLYERVPSAIHVINTLKDNKVFENGGFLAGGFLKRLVYEKDLEKMLNKEKNTRTDLDLFFRNTESALKIAVELGLTIDSPLKFAKEGSIRINKPKSLLTGLYNGLFGQRHEYGTKVQCIYKIEGTPEEILSGFDLVNSMIATDGQYVYMHKDWEQIEQDKIIKVNIMNPLTMGRIHKYCTYNDSKIDINTKNHIIDYCLSIIQEIKENELKPVHDYRIREGIKFNALESLRQFIKNTDNLKNEDIIYFINQLGRIELPFEKDYNNIRPHSIQTQEFICAMISNRQEFLDHHKKYGPKE